MSINLMGIIVLYSLYSGLQIDHEELVSVADEKGCPVEWLPSPTPNHEGVIEVKGLRRSIAKVMDICGGVQVRDNGGAVFIPSDNIKKWKAFENTIRQFAGVEFVNIEVAFTEANRKMVCTALWKSVVEGFIKEIKRVGGTDKQTKGNINALSDSFVQALKENYVPYQLAMNVHERLENSIEKIGFYGQIACANTKTALEPLLKAKSAINQVIGVREAERAIIF